MGNAVNAGAVRNYFAPTRVTGVTSGAAMSRGQQAASQGLWLTDPENEDCFRGPENIARVKAWRARHPGYWRKPQPAGTALQDLLTTQPIGSTSKTANIVAPPLQEII